MLIYTHANRLLVENAKNLLENAGVIVGVRNDHLAGGAGELAPTDIWAELWLVDPSHERLAREVLAPLAEDAEPQADWQCDNCGETNYSSFNLCWNCQHRKKAVVKN